jgi:predicted DNA-binding transcriptional regulator AlpA
LNTTLPSASEQQRLLLVAEEVSPLLGLSPRELYRAAAIPEGHPGALPPGVVVRIGRRVRFSRPALEAWLGIQRNGDGP